MKLFLAVVELEEVLSEKVTSLSFRTTGILRVLNLETITTLRRKVESVPIFKPLV